MKTIVYFLLVLLPPLVSGETFKFEKINASDAGFQEEKLAEIDATFSELYLDGRIPNYVLGVYQGENFVYQASDGMVRTDGGRSVDENTVYWMASMTKPVVSTAVLRLAEQGKISLDDKISKYFPEMQDMLVAPGGSYETTLEPAREEITLRHLISHTSGLTYQTNVTGVGEVAQQYDEFGVMACFSGDGPEGRKISSLAEEVAFLAQLPLIDHPGESWNYSVGIDVLGAVIEQVTGMRLSAYLESEIFAPLGMSRTGFEISPEMSKNASELYFAATPAQLAEYDFEGSIDWKILPAGGGIAGGDRSNSDRPCDSGGGGLFSTVNDFAIYLKMIANDGELNGYRVLNKDSINEHLADQTPQLLPEAFRRGFGEDASSYMKFSAGFGMKMDVDPSTSGEVVDYFFWGGAANTFFWLDKQNDTIGVFATHIMPSLYNVSDKIEQIVDEARSP